MRLCLFFALLIAAPAFSQQNLPQEAQVIYRVIDKNHFDPHALDDSFSARLFDHIVNELDENKTYLTQADIQQLKPWRLQLDDEIRAGKNGFFPQLATIWKTSISTYLANLKLLAETPINPDKPGNFIYNESVPAPADLAALKERQDQYFRYKVLDALFDMHDADSVPASKAVIKKDELIARKQVASRLQKFLQGALDSTVTNKVLRQLYLSGIATCYDPHSEYFPPQEKKAFDESLSSQRMMYGFALSEKDGGYEITSLVPGSPAWNSGSIHVNDKITQLKSADGKTTVDMNDADRKDLDEIFASKDTALEITVQSADGKTNTVKLKKELVDNDENFVKGYILSHEGKKTGYIALPSFYIDWNDERSSSCANDVSKEIVKLKKEGIDALLLDLRYNGGGSVQEALELAGIFIDAGPLSLAKERSGKTMTLKDPARGTIYDGPMGVMINGQSASASELLAGALQDYNRAVIIGGRSFGKATMQIVLPMDSSFNYLDETKSPPQTDSYVKVTTGKLYRITGKTNQLNGITPDVILPDPIQAYDYTERKMPFALPSDTVMKKVLFTPLKPLPIATLATNSNNRISGNPYFTGIKNYMATIEEKNAARSIPLQWDNFYKWERSLDMPGTVTEKKATKYFSIANASFDNSLLQLDPYQQQMNQKVKDDIINDPYIEEALKVIEDLVKTP